MTPGRLLALLLVANVALVAIGRAVAPLPPEALAGKVRVGLVFDVGGKNDKSFNESAWRGLMRARDELGVAVTFIEPSEGADRESALRALAADGNALVIGVGFIFSADLERLAPQFPGVKFAGVDYAPTPGVTLPQNLVGLEFRDEEGSYVVGAIAAWSSHTQTVGFVGGMQIPLIRKFEAGYIAGVKHACPTCTVLSAYAGTEPKAFSDAPLGQELASAQYDRGADIIFHAAGKTGDGVFAAARQRKVRAIGVDSDQFDAAPCCVMTSMLKRVDVAVVEAVKTVQQGTFVGGKVMELGLKEGGVDFVADARNAALLPAPIVARARALAAQIIDGQIAVPKQ